MRKRLIAGPILAVYWWLREFPLEKTAADLRFEARLWAIAGHRDLARLCRLRAEALDHPAGGGRHDRMLRADAYGLIAICGLVMLTVVFTAAQVLRWVL